MFSAIPSVVRADALAVGASIAGPSTITLTLGVTVGSVTAVMAAPTFNATVRTAVQTGALLGGVANCAGCLDFFYQITINTADDGPNRTTVTSYAPAAITTNVWQLTNGSLLGLGFVNGTILSTTADRFTAAVVGQTYAANALVGGVTTMVFAVRTNATAFVPGIYNAIDGSVGSVASLAPTITPEPSTAVLLGSGLFGLVGFARRRKNT
jgi:hypothetical protein